MTASGKCIWLVFTRPSSRSATITSITRSTRRPSTFRSTHRAGLKLNVFTGILMLMYSGNSFRAIPEGWDAVLREHNLVLVCADNSGDGVAESHRMGLALYVTLGLQQHDRFNAKRLYAIGGGASARMAERLGFYASNVFKGEIAVGAADFYQPLPAGNSPASNPSPIGPLEASDSEIAAAKKNSRFAIVNTLNGAGRDALHDLVENDFQKNGFRCLEIRQPVSTEEFCSAKALAAAVDFLDGVQAAPAAKPEVEPVKPQCDDRRRFPLAADFDAQSHHRSRWSKQQRGWIGRVRPAFQRCGARFHRLSCDGRHSARSVRHGIQSVADHWPKRDWKSNGPTRHRPCRRDAAGYAGHVSGIATRYVVGAGASDPYETARRRRNRLSGRRTLRQQGTAERVQGCRRSASARWHMDLHPEHKLQNIPASAALQ